MSVQLILCMLCIVEGCDKDDDADEGHYIKREKGNLFICREHAEKGLRGEHLECKGGGYIDKLVDISTKEKVNVPVV